MATNDSNITAAQLTDLFRAAEQPPTTQLVGAEAEKFGVDALLGTPLSYDGPRGVLRVFEALVEGHGWVPKREVSGGPIIALHREQASVTLEPGAQLELSGSPKEDIHAVLAEMRGHFTELREVSGDLNLIWLSSGFHPLATQAELPWVPKLRYGLMREYFPRYCSGGHDMMRRTATLQANFDYHSEEDAMRKLRTLLRLSPILAAMTANGPFAEGKLNGLRSRRGHVWLHMDPVRSGLLPDLWAKERPRYEDYAAWAVEARMFLVQRGERAIHNRDQTFRAFLEDGFEGERATAEDWERHLGSLFPEIRLKKTLEVRCCDAQPLTLVPGVLGLLTGLVYDEQALASAEELARTIDLAEVNEARPRLVQEGLTGKLGERWMRDLACDLLTFARGGLERRARLNHRDQTEAVYLEPLEALAQAGLCPADLALEGLDGSEADLRSELLARTVS